MLNYIAQLKIKTKDNEIIILSKFHDNTYIKFIIQDIIDFKNDEEQSLTGEKVNFEFLKEKEIFSFLKELVNLHLLEEEIAQQFFVSIT